MKKLKGILICTLLITSILAIFSPITVGASDALVADAGTDQTVDEGEIVHFSASPSPYLKVLWYDNYEEYPYAGSIRQYLDNTGYIVTYFADSQTGYLDLSNYMDYDVMVAEHTSGDYTIRDLQQWFQAGKGYVGLINCDMYTDSYDCYIRTLLNVNTDGVPVGESSDIDWSPSELYWTDPDHSIATYPNSGWDIKGIYPSQCRNHIAITNGNNIVEYSSGMAALVAGEGYEGAGKIACLGTNFHGGARTDPETRKLVENMIVWTGNLVELRTYEWDFDGDGVYDYEESPHNAPDGSYDGKTTHIYGNDDVYTVTLRITDETSNNETDTCTDTCTITVNNVAPEASILGGIAVVDNYILVTNYYAKSYYIDILDDGTLDSPEFIDDKSDKTYGAGIGDFDNDGDLDALVGDRYNTWYYEKTGDGNSFAPAVSIDSTYHQSRSDFAEADFNNDGNLDAIMAGYKTNYYIIYLGNGDGTFTRITMSGQNKIVGMDTGDFNGDGNMDFIAASWSYGAFVYLGNGDGTFGAKPRLNIGKSWGVCAGDFDNDGDDDFIFGQSTKASFYPGDGNGNFGARVDLDFNMHYSALAESDINGDGNLDIVYTYGSSVYYRTGNGDGTFSYVSSTYLYGLVYGIATYSESGSSIEINEGDVTAFTGEFSDPGWLDAHTATWDWGDESPTDIGTITEENDEPFATGGVSGSHAWGNNGEYTITLTVFDDDTSDSDTATVYVLNVPPVAHAGPDYIVEEGSILTLDGTGTYDPGFLDVLTYTWEYGDSSSTESGIDLDSPPHTYDDNGLYTITLNVDDDDGESDSDTADVMVNNVAPTIITINAPLDPVQLRNPIDVTAEFFDPGVFDTHTATIDWGDSNIDDLGTVTSPISALPHIYSETGVYTITLIVTDNDGGIDTKSFKYVVIYDPDSGFVTGGGWINSPLGAYIPDPNLIGKANFGFVSKYKKGQQIPSGNTEFNFKAGYMNFHSNNYDWLVLAGAKAMYKGTGTINGEGNYGFMLSAVDEKLTPSIDVDFFRIKIWDKDNNDEFIYDNEMGIEEDGDPTTDIGGGNIKIHKS